ncbi:MAG: hypothetical protein EBY39_11465 [Flavobacteriia bacterium]|nr:hypothetical protein [Flavobacteriia bacterium]
MTTNYFLRQEGSKVFMCCGKAGCPSVEFNSEGMVQISDDFGNQVKMNKEEAALIAGAVEQLKTFEGTNKSKVLKGGS